MAIRKRITGTPYSRIMAQIEIQPNGCWWWTGLLSDQGYARIRINRRTVKVHRVLYEIVKGAIPDGLDLDHECHDPRTCLGGITCLHRRCINPDHLAPASRSVNVSKSRIVGNTNSLYQQVRRAIQACPRGHLFTEENTRRDYKNTRRCVECARVRAEMRRMGLVVNSASLLLYVQNTQA